MKLNAGVSTGQSRAESIYLHTPTTLVEEKLSDGHILITLKSPLQQKCVNGRLMDVQKQVLFLLATTLGHKARGCTLT